MVLSVSPLSYRSVQITDPITGNQATVVAGALTVSSSGGGGGSVTQGTVPWVVSGQGTAGTAATGVVTVQGIASMTKLLVTPDAVALPAGSAIVGKVGIDQTTPGTTNGVQVNAALPAGTNLMGKVGIDQTTIGTTNGVTIVPGTTTGWVRSSYIVANNTTAVVVHSGACLVGKIVFTTNSSTIAYIKLYDATSATAGSGTPVDRIMTTAPAAGGGGQVSPDSVGATHATGCTFIVTTGIADNDTGVPAASSYLVTIWHNP